MIKEITQAQCDGCGEVFPLTGYLNELEAWLDESGWARHLGRCCYCPACKDANPDPEEAE